MFDFSLNMFRNVVDWSCDDGVDFLKDKVCRERLGVKFFMVVLVKLNGIFVW